MDHKVSEQAQAAADRLKEQGYTPVYTVIAGQEFVFRPITRAEWRELIRRRNQQAAEAGDNQIAIAEIQEDSAEEFTKMAVVYPENFDVSKAPAGIVNSLSDAILLESGFAGPDVEPVKL
ncbi:MAG: hypothetical protein D6710_08305 [Nitrospirae bacterium]|nr:MAG: hypothetical protein D6710_08305 [Nitrospirota bacterium]